jgi:hypothetical protein
MTWPSIALATWMGSVSLIFAVVYGRDLVARTRRGVKPHPLAHYVMAVHVCIGAVMWSLLLSEVVHVDLRVFRLFVLAVLAGALTYGLGLLLHYRR